jgi:flagellin-like protein
MKGLNPIIASAVVIAIAISAMYLVLNLGTPGTDRLREMLIMQEAKDTLKSIDNAVMSVSSEGQGSTRNLKITVTGGYYSIDTENEAVLFSMDSFAQIIGIGVSKTEDNINIRGEPGKVYLNITYDNFNITGGTEFGEGTYSLIIRNDGYANQKQIMSISV